MHGLNVNTSSEQNTTVIGPRSLGAAIGRVMESQLKLSALAILLATTVQSLHQSLSESDRSCLDVLTYLKDEISNHTESLDESVEHLTYVAVKLDLAREVQL